MEHLFVYGTLKRGYERHALLQGQEFLGEAATEACYRLFDCGAWPALVVSSPGVSVRGELYLVSESCLLACDAEEGVAEGLYARQRVSLQTSGYPVSANATAWGYCYLRSTRGLKQCGTVWPAAGPSQVNPDF